MVRLWTSRVSLRAYSYHILYVPELLQTVQTSPLLSSLHVLVTSKQQRARRLHVCSCKGYYSAKWSSLHSTGVMAACTQALLPAKHGISSTADSLSAHILSEH
jgi:hypothetical protein